MTENVETFKVITLGDTGVGKTSIAKRYTLNTFEDDSLSTVGIAFSFKEAKLKNGAKIRLKLIDTAGQEQYRSIAKSYYKNADGVLFVFAYDNKNSFEHIEEWFESFKENSNKEDIPMILIGNKIDIAPEKKEIKNESIKELKEKIGIKNFTDTSAKENIGIENVFNELSEEMYEVNKLRIKRSQSKLKLMNEKTIFKDRNKNNCVYCKQTV